MEVGKYYLFVCSWDWTFVGRFSRIEGGKAYIDHAFYFVKTGKRFGELCRIGTKKAGSEISACGNDIGIGAWDEIKTIPWQAPVDWSNPDEGK